MVDDLESRQEARMWMTHAIPEMQRALFQPDPFAAVVDAAAYVAVLQAELRAITSRAEAGRPVADLYPNLRGHVDLAFTEPDAAVLAACDLVFFATPNGTAMQMVPELLAGGTRVIDLAADFRLQDEAEWAHPCHRSAAAGHRSERRDTTAQQQPRGGPARCRPRGRCGRCRPRGGRRWPGSTCCP